MKRLRVLMIWKAFALYESPFSNFTFENPMGTTGPKFTFENCATCSGQGTTEDKKPCQPCHGKGRILVIQPTIRCPRCRGTGRREIGGVFASDYCVVCFGTGWCWTEFHLAGSTVRKAAAGLIDSGPVSRSSTTLEDES
jgi:hypothetical protein